MAKILVLMYFSILDGCHLVSFSKSVINDLHYSFLIRMFADKLSDNIIQSVIDLLFEQLKLLVENTSKLILLEISENASESGLEQRQGETSHKHKQLEGALCYFMKFLRRVAVTKAAQQKLISRDWLDLLMAIVSFPSETKEFSHFSLRTRMLTFHLLTFVLPACEDDVLIGTVSMVVSHWIFLLDITGHHAKNQSSWKCINIVMHSSTCIAQSFGKLPQDKNCGYSLLVQMKACHQLGPLVE